MNLSSKCPLITLSALIAFTIAAPVTWADTVSDWNVKTCDIVTEAGLVTPPANRVLAIVHTAVYEAATL